MKVNSRKSPEDCTRPTTNWSGRGKEVGAPPLAGGSCGWVAPPLNGPIKVKVSKADSEVGSIGSLNAMVTLVSVPTLVLGSEPIDEKRTKQA